MQTEPTNGARAQHGVIYLAFGEPYLAMALLSYSSLRASNPEVPACIVTNVAEHPLDRMDGWRQDIDHWIHIKSMSSENRNFKTSINAFSPFETSIYLDCDTLVISSLYPLLEMMNYFDVALRIKGPKIHGNSFQKLKVLDEKFSLNQLPHWNSGVIAFRSGAGSDRFFDAWSHAYTKLGNPRDQPALVEAVFSSDFQLLSLDRRWNMTDKESGGPWSQEGVAVLHYMSRIDGFISDRILEVAKQTGLDNNQTVSEFLDKRTKNSRKNRNKFKQFIQSQFSISTRSDNAYDNVDLYRIW